MRIMFVGSNPSVKSQFPVPFWQDVKSTKILMGWIFKSEANNYCDQLSFTNISDQPTENNRPLKASEIKSSLFMLRSKIEGYKPTHIIALGKTAEKALTLLGVQHFAMPHPSGLNRKLNDKAYVAEKINGLKNYLKPV